MRFLFSPRRAPSPRCLRDLVRARRQGDRALPLLDRFSATELDESLRGRLNAEKVSHGGEPPVRSSPREVELMRSLAESAAFHEQVNESSLFARQTGAARSVRGAVVECPEPPQVLAQAVECLTIGPAVNDDSGTRDDSEQGSGSVLCARHGPRANDAVSRCRPAPDDRPAGLLDVREGVGEGRTPALHDDERLHLRDEIAAACARERAPSLRVAVSARRSTVARPMPSRREICSVVSPDATRSRTSPSRAVRPCSRRARGADRRTPARRSDRRIRATSG